MDQDQKFIHRVLTALLLTVLLLGSAVAAGARLYSTYRFRGTTSININLFFDNLEEQSLQKYREDFNKAHPDAPLSMDPSAPENVWGHIGNPYVISQNTHLQNLATLQNNGFFTSDFPKTAKDYVLPQGETFTRNDMPYFLVSDKQGKPVTVGGGTIPVIGSAEYPFIGSIKGVSGAGTTLTGGIVTTTSAIHNVTIAANPGNIDVGLFGKIGCLGKRPPAGSTDPFAGIPSELSNLVFSDVKISVTQNSTPSLAGHILFKDLFAELQKSQTRAGEYLPDPRETHHLGILVGHVEYAKASNLSIYYSSGSVNAISLSNQGADQNYFCSTGYFGLIDNLNPSVDKTGSLVAGSGLNNGDISYGYGGGGGLLSGTQPGYIRAKEIYQKFGGDPANPDKEIILVDAKDAAGNDLAQPAIEDHLFWKSTGGYYFYDGIFTFALSSGQVKGSTDVTKQDTLRSIWPKPAKTKEMVMTLREDGFEHVTIPGAEGRIPVVFFCEPENVNLQVWAEQDDTRTVIEPEQKAVWFLYPGTYFYSAELSGYESLKRESFTVTAEDERVQIPVRLVKNGEENSPETEPSTEETTLPSESATEPAANPETKPTETAPPTEATQPPTESIPQATDTPSEGTLPDGEITWPDQTLYFPEMGITVFPIGSMEQMGIGVLPMSNVEPVVETTETLPTAETVEERTVPDATVPETQPAETEKTVPAATTETVPAETVPKEKPVLVRFACEPTDLKLSLWTENGSEKTEILPECQKKNGFTKEKNVYLLLPGTYFYGANHPQCHPLIREVLTVDGKQTELKIKLSLQTIESTTEPTTGPATEPGTEPTTGPTTEPGTEPTTDPAMEPGTEPTTGSATEPGTEPTAPQNTEPEGKLPQKEEDIPDMDVAIPRVVAEMKAVENPAVDQIELSKTWAIDQKGEQTYYYQVLEQVDDLTELNLLLDLLDNPNAHPETPDIKPPLGFYIGYLNGSTGEFEFINLTKVQDKGDQAPSAASPGELIKYTDPHTNVETDRLRYTKEEERIQDTLYLIDIHRNSDGTFEFHGRNNEGKFNNLRLGVFTKYLGDLITTKQLQILSRKQSTALEGGRWEKYYYDFKYNLATQKDANSGSVSWSITSAYASRPVRLNSDGSGFHVDFWKGFTPAPFSIYAVYQDEYINRSDYYQVPKDQNILKFPANEYVLWPNNEYTGSTSVERTENSYSLRRLSDLKWKDQNGKEIWPVEDLEAGTNEGLTKMFDLKSSVDWTVQGELLGFNLGNIGQSGKLLQVPVGTGSYKQNIVIPTGSLAFHVNKQFTPEHPGKIRVIVKVPSSVVIPSTSPGSIVGDADLKDYYLGLWKGEKKKQGILNFYGFSKNSAMKVVEMPMSQRSVPTYENPENPEGQPLPPPPEGQTKLATRAIKVTYPFGNDAPGQAPVEYTTYLQGETVMLAYEFHVTDPGVYILAASDSAMQIAYCSADGIASAGRDGTGGAALGNIDFVYDNGGQVIPVTKTPPKGVAEDPSQYYYESNILFHFNNLMPGNPRTKNGTVQIYRSRIDPKPTSGITTKISVNRSGADAQNMLVDPISQNHDQIYLDGTLFAP